MQHKDRIVLQKILEVINETAEISTAISEEKFLKNNLLTMAILRVGELVKNLSFELRQNYPEIEWKAIAGFRDIIAHKYEAVDMEEVYKTITADFPELKIQIEKILAE